MFAELYMFISFKLAVYTVFDLELAKSIYLIIFVAIKSILDM